MAELTDTQRVAGWPSNAAQTRALLLQLLIDEYGDEEWAELGSLRRITRFVDDHFDAIIREHVTAALDEIEKRIDAASWFTFDANDVSPDEEFVRRSDAQHAIRGYRQEQGR